MKHVGNVQRPITFLPLSAAIANSLLTFNSGMEIEKKEGGKIVPMCRLEVPELQ